jgi:hypothetical protein
VKAACLLESGTFLSPFVDKGFGATFAINQFLGSKGEIHTGGGVQRN